MKFVEPQKSVNLKINPADAAEGAVGLVENGMGARVTLGKIRNVGTHLVRIAKRGDAITFSICMNYADCFTRDLSRTIPIIRQHAPFLDGTNMFVFDGAGVFKPVRPRRGDQSLIRRINVTGG